MPLEDFIECIAKPLAELVNNKKWWNISMKDKAMSEYNKTLVELFYKPMIENDILVYNETNKKCIYNDKICYFHMFNAENNEIIALIELLNGSIIKVKSDEIRFI